MVAVRGPQQALLYGSQVESSSPFRRFSRPYVTSKSDACTECVSSLSVGLIQTRRMNQTRDVGLSGLSVEETVVKSADLAKEMVAAANQNGVVLRGFVQSVTRDGALAEWAKELCTALQPAGFSISVYEGVDCEPGESFAAQVRKALQDKIGKLNAPVLAADTATAGLEAVATLMERMVAFHVAAVPYSEQELPDMRFMVKIEVNRDGACVKFHDDMVDVRVVTTLVGDGTVISDNTGVDWEFYGNCDGQLLHDTKAGKNFSDVVREWNSQVVSTGELSCAPGDVGVMKGGLLTNRPCLHRAPYSADCGSSLPRFLVTLERMNSDTVEQFKNMECDSSGCSDCSDCSDQSSGEDEDEDMGAE